MKKFFSLFIISLFFIVGCSSDSDTTPEIAGNFYDWSNVGFKEGSILSLRSDLAFKDGMIVATVKSGTGDGSRANVSCANLGMKSPATGIDIDVWANENIQEVGIQWWENKMGAENFYEFYISKSGYFKINKAYWDSTKKKRIEGCLKNIKPEDTGLDVSKFNNIKTCIKKGNFEIYLNGKNVYTIKGKDLTFGSNGHFFIVYKTISKQAYTSEKQGLVKFNLKQQQNPRF